MKLPRIGNYQAIELIHDSDRTLVYRGWDTKNDRPVAIKLMGHEYPSFNELVQFKNQYAITQNLDIEGIVKPYALERYKNRYALIVEDRGSISLAEYRDKKNLPLLQLLDIACQLADILHQLHQKQIIHKDIKPANILIHPETQQIQLTDFSISTLLPKETQTLTTPNVLEGTLAYLSPEQTGRMNRGIDYRCDFYALGVTLYELLTGVLPFESNDPMELVHAHLARSPRSPRNFPNPRGEMPPEAIAEIILKLMAKNAEDRYQSALGLKYDLERCRTQWQASGKIEPFVLREGDLCDRFNIPEKLYGREKEVQTLLDAFERVAGGTSEIMLVAGRSGIGKTSVVNEVHKPIARQRGYFIKGKFDQFNRSIPFSAFVQAFRDLMRQLLAESDRQLQAWKAEILAAVGDNGQVLLEVIPELEQIIGQQPPVPELFGGAVQNRFNLLFEKFIAVFTTQAHPLTIFIDDLQWADLASLDLIKVLVGGDRPGYLLVLGAYRDNEVSPAHPLLLTLADLEAQNTAISTISLPPLSRSHVDRLISETLILTGDSIAVLGDLTYQKTQGNPFFTTQFLKGLYQDGLIVFNPDLRCWECDGVKVQRVALTDDVVEFMAGRLCKLSENTQKVLKLAACVGNQFDLETLAIICETSPEEAAAALWSALREGLILPESEAYKFFQTKAKEDGEEKQLTVSYRFLHDRVQQAAYALIEDKDKKAVHLQIGRLLLKNTPVEALSARLFNIVDRLNMAWELMADESERVELARLNLEAGKKAKSSTAYAAALEKYLTCGIEMLPAEKWHKYYDLTFSLYRECSECEYLCGNFDAAEARFDEILRRANSDIERAEIQNMRVILYDNTGKYAEAIAIASEAIGRFGVNLPTTDREAILAEFEQELKQYRKSLEAIDICELLDAAEMRDPATLACMKLLANLTGPAFFTNQDLCALISLKMVNLSIAGGISEGAAYGYAYWGIMVGPRLDDYQAAYEFGQLGLQLADRFDNPNLYGKICDLFGAFINFWRNHLRAGIPILRRGFQIGAECLDLWATYNGYHSILHRILCSENLDSILEESQQHIEFCNKTRNYIFAGIQQLYQGFILNLQGLTLDRNSFSTESLQEEEYLQRWQETSFMPGIVPYFIFKAQIAFSCGNYQEALEMAQKSDKDLIFISGIPSQTHHYLYYSLILAALHGMVGDSQQREYEETLNANQEKLKLWADNCPENFLHKYILVEAEKAKIAQQYLEAMNHYDRAIALAEENGYIHEAALGSELAARFYLTWDFGSAQSKGREKIAAVYMQEAYYRYAQWGAKAKTDDLERHYPELLAPILDRPTPNLQTNATILSPKVTTISTTSTGVGERLDIAALMKAARTLSREIDRDRAIANLMQVILENAGAETAALMLFREDVLMLEAKISAGQVESIAPIPVDESHLIPLAIVNTVKRTQTPLILADARQDSTYIADAYLQSQQPRSILCLPLSDAGRAIGILYLENNQAIGAFTRDRVEMLKLLCAQAAIALDNARLYQQAQQSLQLERDLHELQRTQLTLIQSEKMFGLGRMVGGIAHEINNPVTFIRSNIRHANAYIQDLLQLLALYRQYYPQPASEIQEAIDAIDLPFLQEDFQNLLKSMGTGSARIEKIVESLRTFSRLDEAEFKAVDLHAGIESTLTILQNRLQPKETQEAIEVIKEYGDLPLVECYAGQFNQVVMNILNNAIDALEECNRQDNLTLRIHTETDGKRVKIAISDNGIGMSEETKDRLFDPFFTTKPVGQGTGLGMAIAYQIITEKHGGTINCISDLGKGTEFAIAIPVV